IEHLMAAFSALGVSNAVVEVDGPELPILDGSALDFVQLLDRAGFRPQPTPQRYIEILETVHVVEGDKHAALMPCDRFEMRFEIDFPSKAIGNQVIDFVVDEPTFVAERDVVKEEYRQRILANPYGRLFGLFVPETIYQDSPYRRPGIGSIEELEASSLD
ncbi:UDP-3-O-acyl-N-acetylglucosamine deacetylase, partial [Lactiplantibacillus plantarum]|nr:UDP-3-O-acyl-N-acetylglucosamine deacetylase [Lactiplantibacillus plantarum]